MITVKRLTLAYKNKTIIKDLSFTVPESGIFALVGASGAGKSTLLNAMAGLIKPTDGEITGISGKKLSMIFQQDRLIPAYNVYDNVALTNEKGDIKGIIGKMGLSEYLYSPLDSLSGGMLRRVSIARAINYGGDILFADEPFKGLDAEIAKDVLNAMKEAFGLIIITFHEVADAKAIGAAGQIVL